MICVSSVNGAAAAYTVSGRLLSFCSPRFFLLVFATLHLWRRKQKPANMKRLIPLLTFLLGGWVAAQAQMAPFAGTVKDQRTGEPLPGASIELSAKGADGKKKEIHLLTGLDGSFVLRHIPAGHYEVSVKVVGFERLSQEMDLADGTVKTVNFTLEPGKKELTAVNVM